MKNPGKITRENILYHRNIDSYNISSVIAFRWTGWRDGRIHAVSLSAFHSTEPMKCYTNVVTVVANKI